ncbi:MAG: hypothetical protein RID11_19020 [Roseovarius sp.]|uniref:hypothetical protein n=1 Tax=Roseovarius sp. TaxID=1486281 RepID=UPI0032ECC294
MTEFTVFFAPQGERHMVEGHSEIAAIAERHGLEQASAFSASGGAFAVTDLGFQDADAYHPYRLDTPDAAGAETFLARELPNHDGIVILRHPDRYEPRKDIFLTVDPGLAADLSEAGFPALVAGPGQAGLIRRALSGAGAAQATEDLDAEMLMDAGEISSTMRPVPHDLSRPGAAPFPVVLGRSALVGGWHAAGRALSEIELMDRVTALMGGDAYELQREDDAIIGGVYETEDFAIEFSVMPRPFADIGYDGPVVYFEQTFDTVPTGPEFTVEESVDQGLRRVAEAIGLCLAVEIPYADTEGWLVGYRRRADGDLEAVRAWLDEEAAEGDGEVVED